MAKKKTVTADVVIRALGACDVPEYITPRMSPKRGFEVMLEEGAAEQIVWLRDQLGLGGPAATRRHERAIKALRAAFPHMDTDTAEDIVSSYPYLTEMTWEDVEKALQTRRVQKRIAAYLEDPDNFTSEDHD